MSVNLAYCNDCRSFDYAAQNNNGSFSFTPQASAHFNHATTQIQHPHAYAPPIRMALMKLGANHEVTETDLVMLKLGLELEGLEPKKPQAEGGQPDLFSEAT